MMMKKRCVLISGAGSGIGLRFAIYLQTLGYQVFAGVLTDEQKTTVMAASKHGRITPLMLDITSASDIEAAVKSVAGSGYALGALVNNAAVVSVAPAEFVPMAELRRCIEINYIGQVAMVQAFMPLIRKHSSRIIFTGSISARYPAPFQAAYAASKAALTKYCDALRMELSLFGIAVSIIEPGGIDSPLRDTAEKTSNRLLDEMPREAREHYEEHILTLMKHAPEWRKHAISPEYVVEALYNALTDTPPRARYVVGLEAQAQDAMGRLFPDSLRDKITMRFLKLKRK